MVEDCIVCKLNDQHISSRDREVLSAWPGLRSLIFVNLLTTIGVQQESQDAEVQDLLVSLTLLKVICGRCVWRW